MKSDKLLEATMKSLQEELNDDINYDKVDVYMNVNMSSLDGNHTFKNKQELETYLTKIFKPNMVNTLLSFDNNEYTEIIEPRNDDNCIRSCKFVFKDNRYKNRDNIIKIKGYYRRPAPEPDKPLTQQEALDEIIDRLEIIYSINELPDYIVVKGEIGGDMEEYRIYKDGHIFSK